jgi:hypothetical protein
MIGWWFIMEREAGHMRAELGKVWKVLEALDFPVQSHMRKIFRMGGHGANASSQAPQIKQTALH